MSLTDNLNDSIMKEGIIASLQECNDYETQFISLTNNNMSTFLKYVLHSVVGVALLGGIALLIKVNPSWFSLTIGSLVVNLYNFLVQTQSTSVSYTKSV